MELDYTLIGKRIQTIRVQKKITQEKLAEMLDVSDRAVSKWERGICMPSTAAMPGLCDILEISINELFCGERIEMKDNKKTEQALLEIAKMKRIALLLCIVLMALSMTGCTRGYHYDQFDVEKEGIVDVIVIAGISIMSNREESETRYYSLASGDRICLSEPFEPDPATFYTIPNGCFVIFLDKNKKNYNIDNLYCLGRNIHSTMCKNRWYTTDRNITLTAIKYLELMQALKG